MEQEQIKLRIAELKAERPDCFDLPGMKPNEVMIGHAIIDFFGFKVGEYHKQGLLSARADMDHPAYNRFRIYVDVTEYILNKSRHRSLWKRIFGKK